MKKHSNGVGITLDIPEDIEKNNIDSCINYINENEIKNIVIISKTNDNLEFLNQIKNFNNVVSLHIEGVINCNFLYNFNELEELSVFPKESDVSIDISKFPKLKAISTSNLKVLANCNTKTIEYLFYNGAVIDDGLLNKLVSLKRLVLNSVKKISLSQLKNLHLLEQLQLTQCGIENLCDLHYLNNLTSLWLFHCKKIHSIDGVSKLKNLKKVWIAACPKIIDLSELAKIEKLQVLAIENMKKIDLGFLNNMLSSNSIECLDIENCADIKNIKFLNDFPNLKMFGFWNTNIQDGDLTPCMRLKFAHTANKRHYNMKANELPQDNINYSLSNWF